jgi:hypothetical protein
MKDWAWNVKQYGHQAAEALWQGKVSIEQLTKGISTSRGKAWQSKTTEAIEAVGEVQQGATLYRVGTLGNSHAAEAQYWSLENPADYLNDPAAFAEKFGIPAEHLSDGTMFIETGKMKGGAEFITREAPGAGSNGGGAIEVVTDKSSVQVETFHTISQ